MNEYWRSVKGYDDELQVSNVGRIKLLNVGTSQLVDGEYQTTIIPEIILEELNIDDIYLIKAVAHIHKTYPQYF